MKNTFAFIIVVLFINPIFPQCSPPYNIHLRAYEYIGELIVAWDTNDAEMWDLEYGISGFTPTGVPTQEDINENFYPLSNIEEVGSNIDFYVRADCTSDTSDWVGPFTFYNFCTDFVGYGWLEESFENDFIPSCWLEADVAMQDAGTTMYGNSAWEQSFFANNPEATQAAKINIQGTDNSNWLILPLSIGVYGCKFVPTLQMEFDIALTQAGGSDTAILGSDDKIQVVVSPDYGVTWFPIQTWDNTSAISSTGEICTVYYENLTDGFDMMQYPFLVGFYASSGTINDAENVDFFVDNLNYMPPFEGSVSEMEALNFHFYPNPVKDLLNFQAEQPISHVTIYDKLGKLISKTNPNALESSIQLDYLKSGVYYINVQIGNAIGFYSFIKD